MFYQYLLSSRSRHHNAIPLYISSQEDKVVHNAVDKGADIFPDGGGVRTIGDDKHFNAPLSIFKKKQRISGP